MAQSDLSTTFFKGNRFHVIHVSSVLIFKNFANWFHCITFVEINYLHTEMHTDMCKSESSQSHESRTSLLIPRKLAVNQAVICWWKACDLLCCNLALINQIWIAVSKEYFLHNSDPQADTAWRRFEESCSKSIYSTREIKSSLNHNNLYKSLKPSRCCMKTS